MPFQSAALKVVWEDLLARGIYIPVGDVARAFQEDGVRAVERLARERLTRISSAVRAYDRAFAQLQIPEYPRVLWIALYATIEDALTTLDELEPGVDHREEWEAWLSGQQS
jgi:hypothetical protein